MWAERRRHTLLAGGALAVLLAIAVTAEWRAHVLSDRALDEGEAALARGDVTLARIQFERAATSTSWLPGSSSRAAARLREISAQGPAPLGRNGAPSSPGMSRRPRTALLRTGGVGALLLALTFAVPLGARGGLRGRALLLRSLGLVGGVFLLVFAAFRA
jgi:hypothetical protein